MRISLLAVLVVGGAQHVLAGGSYFGLQYALNLLSSKTPSNTSVQPILDIPGIPRVPHATPGNGDKKGSLPLDDIQADILVGMTKPQELFLFFTITKPSKFKSALRKTIVPMITSVTEVLKRNTNGCQAIVNIGFSSTGLQTLGVQDSLNDTFFAAGQFNDSTTLGDLNASKNWVEAFRGNQTHGVLLIASSSGDVISKTRKKIHRALGSSAKVEYTLHGEVRKGSETGHEHFGFLDGISQPAVQGFQPPLPGQSFLLPGEILTGETGDNTTRPAWAKDGSFLVFRQLQQFVPEFNKFTVDHPIEGSSELTGARMIGRWKSGAPVDLSPQHDDLALAMDLQRNQNFTYNHPEIKGFDLSSDQSHCPFSAHMRKTRPRADLGNLATRQILRAGIPYGPDVTEAELEANTTAIERGLAFVCYQSDIGRSFRFLQSSWANNLNFPPNKTDLHPGLDPVIGATGTNQTRPMDGLDINNPQETFQLQSFVESRGGEYFFSPSISALSDPIAKAPAHSWPILDLLSILTA